MTPKYGSGQQVGTRAEARRSRARGIGPVTSALVVRSARPPAFFQFDRYHRQHYARYSWGGTEECEEHFTGSWSRQTVHFARWMTQLIEQTDPTSPTTAPSVVPLL